MYIFTNTNFTITLRVRIFQSMETHDRRSWVLKGPGFSRVLQSPGSLFSGMPIVPGKKSCLE